jgi:hypothetical protein
MKKLKFCLPVIALTVFIFSCKKDKDEVPALTPGTAPTYPDYSQLKVGNYWVYELFDVDSSGNATTMNNYDSCYVEKDTLINNAVYYKMWRSGVFFPNWGFWLVRDSLHYVVTSSGKILFSSKDFTTVFDSYYITAGPGDTVAYTVVKMEDQYAIVNTPAGDFPTLDSRLTYYMYPNWSFNGSVRPQHTRYARNLGIVIETLPIYSSQPNYIERRLIRYHLN